MTRVFIFAASNAARRYREVGGNSLQRLDARLLIDADGVDAFALVKRNGLAIRLTDRLNLLMPSLRIIDFRS